MCESNYEKREKEKLEARVLIALQNNTYKKKEKESFNNLTR